MAAAGAPTKKYLSTNVFDLAAHIQYELIKLRKILCNSPAALKQQPSIPEHFVLELFPSLQSGS